MKRLPFMLVHRLPVVVLCPLFGTCSGHISLGSPIGSTFLIGDVLPGPPGGQSIVLLNNGRDSLTLAVNGPFVFGGLAPSDGSYMVTISTQPASVNYVMMNGNGRVNGDVNNVRVTCQPC